MPNIQDNSESNNQTKPPSVDEKIREAAAKKLYQTIKPWQTRILRVDPATKFENPLICTLLVADVIVHEGLGVVEEDGPREIHYEALSYTWGAPIFSRPIQINRIQFFITDNLDSALRHLRLGDAKRYLWVDALCINQFDVKEKSVQVGRMFPIYQKARRVVAWNSGWTREKCDILSTVLENMSSNQKHSDDCLVRLKDLRQFLSSACEPPLFKRTWVRQETFAARELVMQFSDLTISWRDYERIKDYIDSIRGRVDAGPESGIPDFTDFTDALYLKSPFNAIMTLVQPDYKHDHKSRNERHKAARHAPVSLLDALIFSSSFGVTDPRDLVYGILGFTTVPISQGVTNTHRATLKVDYSRSVSEVYQDVVKYEISRSGSLAILDFAGSRPTPDLPSWTPDWKTYDPKLAQHRVLNRTNSWKYGFIDVQKIGASWKPAPQPSDTYGVLYTRGVVLGTIQDDIDENTGWKPFVSPYFEAGFKERFGGRGFDDEKLFPGVKRDYKSTFHNLYDDVGLPLYGGKVSGVRPSKACERLLTLAQVEMLDKIKSTVRNRIIVPPEPIRWNHIIGLASPSISLAPKTSLTNDIIVLFQGARCPFVIRRIGQEKHILVGRAVFPLWYEHKSASFDDLSVYERTWSSNNAVYTETSDVLESRFLWPETMASVWRPVLEDAEFLGALEDFTLT
ncbi:heterokaryon incompatibility protein-domain-containing protein [Hypoxylon trugodes]|uniref:heterokaryon incompatibility protein-domain-containing protein n=1 Tax=Hypoxylon trugodes TaxID=326681 RepID=UPI00218F3F98|nr:heterokaryon incompatibility protein-domain-containing protein [Hypoxylon trugodes]KAI1392517.1 heterokaryon incompatibility protein-domain-containing protein [Hypoxylon trugodes]